MNLRRRIGPLIAGNLAALAIVSGAQADDDDIVRFSGRIDNESVAAFVAAHRDRVVRRVVVDSPGGSIGDALVLANWMLDRGVDVEVDGRCISSCANYLFAAGRRRIIDARSIVVWHGSALQKDIRDRARHCDGGADDRAFCATARDVMAQQQAFFARIDGSEYITRLGQEPHDFGAIWTVPVETMNRLGYRDVEAPAGYGSAEYVRHFNTSKDTEPIVSLGVREDGTVDELGR